MSQSTELTPLNLCGVYELESGGKILYCSTHSSDGYFKRSAEMIGNNFYEIARFENAEDFRRKIKFFLQNSNSTEDFNFDCRFSESIARVKVRLVRVSERASEESSNFVIVDIRKV